MPDYTQQLNELVELMRRQPLVPQWMIGMIGAVLGGLIGFASTMAVSFFNRRKDRRNLNDGLLAELDFIFSELRTHLHFLKTQSVQTGPSETNFGEFIKGDLFQAVQSTPLYWSLKTGPQLVEAHRHLKYLDIRKSSDTRGDVIAIENALGGIAKSISTKVTTEYLREIDDTSCSGKP